MKINDLTVDGLEQENYFATQELIDVVNAAIFLDKPLLIEGPAGTGKTFLAKTLSALLNLELIRLQCHEGIDEDKSVYEWNYKKQLLSIQKSEENENLFDEKYLIKRPILSALTTEENSLFLIDEIDRSDEEFEALLLEILAENQVTIPEFGTIKGNENRITILTSNSTRELSDALRRRCIYYYLDFPSIEIETKVFMNSIEDIEENENLFDEKYLIKRPILTALTTEENSLFLIDEIDRSDEEFEALLLEVLAENQVTIPEFGTIKGSENRITILTSNSTRELSDALRRRCIYYYLDFPSIEIETKVFMNSIEDIDENEARKYASLVSFIRSLSLNKIPSLIESVEWVKYNNSKDQESVRSNLGILLKDKSDQKKYVEKLEESNEFNQE